MNCPGYQTLLAAVERDERESPRCHNYHATLEWAVQRAQHYAERTGLKAEDILDAWETKRDYWYMNYYQEANQPSFTSDQVRVFDTVAALQASVGQAGFRCPNCEGVSRSPYECNSGLSVAGKPCNWKVYGLFGHLGKGVTVFVKDQLQLEKLFAPIAWENPAPNPQISPIDADKNLSASAPSADQTLNP